MRSRLRPALTCRSVRVGSRRFFVVSREESIQRCLGLKLEIETALSNRLVTPEEEGILRASELRRIQTYQEKFPVAYKDIHIQPQLKPSKIRTPEDVRALQERAAQAAIDEAYRKQVRLEEQARIKAWEEANPEQYREIVERSQAELRQHIRDVNQAWYDKNKVYRREYIRQLYQVRKEEEQLLLQRLIPDPRRYDPRYVPPVMPAVLPLDVYRLGSQRRRSRVSELPTTLTLGEWREILLFYHYQCVYCGIRSHALTQDHLVPVVLQGGYTKENIVPACHICNSRKHTGYLPFVVTPMPQHLDSLAAIKAISR